MPRGSDPTFVVAAKQIYASRYFGGSLSLTLGVIDPAVDSSFYVVYVNRTRPASVPAMFSLLIRPFAQSRAKTGLEENLRLTKNRLESDYRQ